MGEPARDLDTTRPGQYIEFEPRALLPRYQGMGDRGPGCLSPARVIPDRAFPGAGMNPRPGVDRSRSPNISVRVGLQ